MFLFAILLVIVTSVFLISRFSILRFVAFAGSMLLMIASAPWWLSAFILIAIIYKMIEKQD